MPPAGLARGGGWDQNPAGDTPSAAAAGGPLPGNEAVDQILDTEFEPLQFVDPLPVATGALLLKAQRIVDAGMALDQSENACGHVLLLLDDFNPIGAPALQAAR